MPDDKIQYLVLDRCDPDVNMARFYVLAIEASLFGDAALIREWGRIGTTGQRKIELHETEGAPWKPSRCGCAASRGGDTSPGPTVDRALPKGPHRIQSAPFLVCRSLP